MLNPTLIQQFDSAPHAIHNDGTLEQLREVMKELFTKDRTTIMGNYKYYESNSNGFWYPADYTKLPIIPVTSFFNPPEKMVKVSDVVAWVEENMQAINASEDGVNSLLGFDYIYVDELKQYLNELE